jgi:hypothetical protein
MSAQDMVQIALRGYRSDLQREGRAAQASTTNGISGATLYLYFSNIAPKRHRH